jgi:hypothetical protein
MGRDPRPRAVRFTRDGAERAAWRCPCRLIGGSMLNGESPHYRASPGPTWSNMVHVARLETTGGWTIGGKVSTGIVHGPPCTCLK